MKVDAVIVSKSVPDWAVGYVEKDGKRLLLLSSKPRHVWPRWWHKLGRALNWRWLQKLHTKRDRFMA